MDWLGVPLNGRDRIIGVLAVQSYSGEVRYTEEDRDLLVFVSSQIAQAVERKRSEETLRANELRLRTIVAALPDLVLVLDRDGRYLEIHATRADNLVLPRETPPRAHDPGVPARARRGAVDGENRARASSRGEAQTLEYPLDVLAGPRVFEARIVPYGADSVLTIVRDVTERARALEALSSAQSELKRRDRQHGRRHQPAGPRGPVPVRQPVARARHGLDVRRAPRGERARSRPPGGPRNPSRAARARRPRPGSPDRRNTGTASGTDATSGSRPSRTSCAARTERRRASSSGRAT